MVEFELKEFKKLYPHADFNKFSPYPMGINFNYGGMGYDVFKNKIGGPIHHYDDPEIQKAFIKALGKRNDNAPHFETQSKRTHFPKAFILTMKKYPIPAVLLDERPSDIKSLLTELKLYVTPSKTISVRLNDVFQLTPPSFDDVSGYSSWLQEPNMKFWSQQLNFAVWCATSGCGIGFDIVEPNTQITSILRFHLIFTIRSILNELQVILPWENNFAWDGTRYNHSAVSKLCREFGVEISDPDFRFKGQSTDSDKFNFHYTSLKSDSLTGYYESTHKSRSQYNWFIPQKSIGLTKAGQARLNQSIEAFVYCILGSQVNTRSSIIGTSGSATETQQEFSTLFESAIIENDISKSIQRYQMAIQEAKVRLDLAIAPGCWLIPSNLVINTQSIIGYNNKLQKATTDMKFGVNNINTETKSVGIKHNFGISKVKLIHTRKTVTHASVTLPVVSSNHASPAGVVTSASAHETNLGLITVVTAGLAWYLFH